jgi:hypothetical protein
VKEHGFELTAVDGTLTKDGLQLAVGANYTGLDGMMSVDSEPMSICGTTTTIRAKVIDPARRLTGREAMSLRTTSPSGVTATLTFSMSEDRTHAIDFMAWNEIGSYQVVAMVAGEHIVGSPSYIRVSSRIQQQP